MWTLFWSFPLHTILNNKATCAHLRVTDYLNSVKTSILGNLLFFQLIYSRDLGSVSNKLYEENDDS